MFISKKRIQVIERRIADLEKQVQGQQDIKLKIDDKKLYSSIGKSSLSVTNNGIIAQVQ
ncbi:hypothetical protein DFR55_10988 [Herbinix hemicellulosilytica]|uniref:Uncharacterized protein n=1 Tax=Herbinix hemicellulosilytica TaxID=1564487 RepID=A0A0H5SIJ6_HERHM|nr:hypothetical protein [Herbinix hemicellulosilytica]RBP58873.1 hypothetical protein DFR55_10988 [Herbinix hemicellulosilytica]CRZ34920.1 hypothetical protein HHT355_1720 [Herbinix hemicellulosilytica]